MAQEAAAPSRPTQGAVPGIQTPTSFAAPRPQPESSEESLVSFLLFPESCLSHEGCPVDVAEFFCVAVLARSYTAIP